ncbi:inner membrane protein import complex subunit Tim54-domain-containing protein [Rhodocollybia butyracea]|uniref:Mitochondrial import inner membrane translocase subunit TIM54 n=1 Tax=Rhodocollybia butyracea TaxID=206335 RepID=A0A9P5PKC9_9AGAR|nr:inner membrane protein import complex subunit Tim54-domain-containing protein [Rhodocollybia butyracea]
MSSTDSKTPASPPNPSLPPKVKPKSGFVAALEYTGIPPSLLKRPRLPSRNWLIFLSVTSSIIGAYVYDRRQCRKLREDYIERVKTLGEEYAWNNSTTQDAHLAWPRKLTVYGARWPGDEDYDQTMRYFRRFIKPIFVAAAIDYDMVSGKKHGDIASRVADEIKAKRFTAGKDSLDHPQANMPAQYHAPSTSEREALELAGGTVIIGRATLKEYLAGVVRGWTEPYELKGRINWGDEAREETVRNRLDDSIFDETEASPSSLIPAPAPLLPPSTVSIPALPPVLLVPFTDYLGFTQIPYMIFDFFYRRRHVRDGGEAAIRAVWGATREFTGPSNSLSKSEDSALTFLAPPPPQGGDLDFALSAESYFRSYLFSPLDSPNPKSPVETVKKAREKYYTELPARLWVAREFSRRGFDEDSPPSYSDSESTSSSPDPEFQKACKKAWDAAKSTYSSDPSKIPPSEVELRLERFEKEKKWLRDEEGWEIVRPERGVTWDARLDGVLRVFVDSDAKSVR